MSDTQKKASEAKRELKLSEEARIQFRESCIDQAIELARAGEQKLAYEKLLMIIAIDSVKNILQGHLDTAVMDESLPNPEK